MQRLNQTADSIRDTIATAISVNLSLITLQENETMKRLAAYAALLAIPTMIAGIYGMNFEHMPELKWRYGYANFAALHGRRSTCCCIFRFKRSQVAVAALDTRRLGFVLAPLMDILAFCAFAGAGLSLRASNAYAFAIGYAPQSVAALAGAARRGSGCGLARRVARRGGRFHGACSCAPACWRCSRSAAGWAPQTGIFFAVALGLAVTAPRWRNTAVGLIVYAFVLRLVYAGSVEMMPEETYYWNYSRHLSFGYLDHPPMVAWLIRAATAVFGQNRIWRTRRRAAAAARSLPSSFTS